MGELRAKGGEIMEKIADDISEPVILDLVWD
jgi:hypothetical protein